MELFAERFPFIAAAWLDDTDAIEADIKLYGMGFDLGAVAEKNRDPELVRREFSGGL